MVKFSVYLNRHVFVMVIYEASENAVENVIFPSTHENYDRAERLINITEPQRAIMYLMTSAPSENTNPPVQHQVPPSA